MSHPTQPLPGLVPCALQSTVTLVEQKQLARDTYRLRLQSAELASRVVPGQFFMVRAPGPTDPLLGRPFALYDVWRDEQGIAQGIDLVYLVLGKATRLMPTWGAGDDVEIWGPLGNGFPVPTCQKLLLVAGGIGNTPFPAVMRESLGLDQYGIDSGVPRTLPNPLRPSDVTFCYGVRSAEYLMGIPELESLGINLQVATDDGSFGYRGFVTHLVEKWLLANCHSTAPSDIRIYCCGPEPMMHAVAKLASQFRTRCWLSLETPMACGFGACFSCVTKVREPDGTWDYRRSCVEGPIFPADTLVFD